jgi:hypothetical protein
MLLFLASVAAILGVPLCGALLGFLQLAWYRWRKTPEDDIPFFLILVFRGMLVLMGLIVVAAVASHVVAGR